MEMEIAEAVEHFKKVKEHVPLTIPLVLYLEKDGEFIANIAAPYRVDHTLATSMMLSTLAAFNADRAIFTCEVNAQHVDSTYSPDEDPSASPAILIVEGKRNGDSEWIISPYGMGDHGEVVWKTGRRCKATGLTLSSSSSRRPGS